MADLIATEAYAQSIGNVPISYTSNLCCTKSRAIALGCDVAGTYADNQLVRKEDLSKKTITLQYTLKNNSTDYFNNVLISAGNCKFTGTFAPKTILYWVFTSMLMIVVQANTYSAHTFAVEEPVNVRIFGTPERQIIFFELVKLLNVISIIYNLILIYFKNI